MSLHPAYLIDSTYPTEYPETVSFGMMSALSGTYYLVNAQWINGNPPYWQYSISKSQSSIHRNFSNMELVFDFLRAN
jgi:hypothetical protein